MGCHLSRALCCGARKGLNEVVASEVAEGLLAESSVLHWLHLAIAEGDIDSVSTAISRGVPLDEEYEGFYPLHRAIKSRNYTVVEMLLQAGACVNRLDSEGKSPLYRAVESRYLSFLSLLLMHRAVVESREHSPLSLAIKLAWNTGASLLIFFANDINFQDIDAKAALHHSIHNLDITGKLLQAGARVDLGDERLETPLHLALREKSEEVALELLRVQSDLSLCNAQGMTYLHCACIGSTHLALKVILRKMAGKYLDLQDARGNVALHYAIYAADLASTKLLLEAGASMDLCNKEGYSPSSLAKELLLDEFSSLLHEYLIEED